MVEANLELEKGEQLMANKDTHMATNTKKTTTEKNTFDVWALEAAALFAEWGTVQTVNAQNVGHWPIKRQPTQKRGK